MATKVIKIEIPIETKDNTGQVVDSIFEKMEELDSAAKKAQKSMENTVNSANKAAVAGFAQLAQYVRSADFGQHHIQQYQMVLAVLQLFQRGFAVQRLIHFVSVLLERKPQSLEDHRFVVYGQNPKCQSAHSSLPACFATGQFGNKSIRGSKVRC